MTKLIPLALTLALACPGAAQILYGQGTPGSSGAYPRLTSDQPFAGNAAFAYRLDRARPGALAALLFSTAPAATSALGSAVWIGLAPTQFLFGVPVAVDANGHASLPGSLAGARRDLIGLRLHVQGVVADLPASGALVATTNGLELEVTDAPSLFVGSDLNGTASDPFLLIDPGTLAVQHTGAPPSTDGASGAVFADGGRRLFVASAARGRIDVADLTNATPMWNAFADLKVPAVGIAHDRRHRRIYTMAGLAAGPKDLVVLDADPASAGYGSEVGRVPALSQLVNAREWHLAATGERLVVYLGGRTDDLVILDTDPLSPSYLGVVDRTDIPGLQPSLNGLRRVRLSSDGSRVFALLNVGFFTMPSGLHRYDVATKRWFDHHPQITGIQPIGHQSSPQGPMVTSSDLAMTRDDAIAVLTDYDAIVRIDLDRDDFSFWRVTRVPGVWVRSTYFGHTVTAEGHALLLGPTALLSDTQASLVDVHTGQVLASRLLLGAPWVSVFAER